MKITRTWNFDLHTFYTFSWPSACFPPLHSCCRALLAHNPASKTHRAAAAAMLSEPLLLAVPRGPSRHVLLCGSLAVFFVQFVALGVPAPFLPTSPAGIAVGPQAVGAIFSSFPLGTVLVGPLVPRALEVFGARLVVSIGGTAPLPTPRASASPGSNPDSNPDPNPNPNPK